VKKPSSAISTNFDEESRSSPTTTNISNENENIRAVEVEEERTSSSSKSKRMVSFANEVNIFEEKHETNEPPIQYEQQQQQQPVKEKMNSTKLRLPSAHETLVDKMDSNLRMLIIKELSKDSQIPKPPSKMSELLK